jgi:hypothetical protein
LLYRNYENRVVAFLPCDEHYDLKVIGGKVSPIVWDDENSVQQKGFSVIADSNSRFVKMTIVSIDTLSQSKNYYTVMFKVLPFTIPEIQGSLISKFMGFKVVLSLSPSSTIQGVSFSVLGGKITYNKKEFKFEGDRVPAELIRKLKNGSIVSLEVEYEIMGRGFGCFKTSKDIKIGL